MENNENLEIQKPKETTQKARFAGFAVSHFVISFVGFAAGLILTPSLETPPSFLFTVVAVVLFALYAIAGQGLARTKQWSFPRRFRDGAKAFLFPALIAWAWGALVVVSLVIGAWTLLMVEFFASAIFAFPSFYMVYLFLGTAPGTELFGMEFLGICLCAFLAGGIPPLLFLLGSLLGSRKAVRCPVHRKEKEDTDETQ